MRKTLIHLITISCFIFILISSTACGEALFDGASAILEQWGAQDGQELYTRILDHWNKNLDGTRLSWPAKIRLGGTTGDLIGDRVLQGCGLAETGG